LARALLGGLPSRRLLPRCHRSPPTMAHRARHHLPVVGLLRRGGSDAHHTASPSRSKARNADFGGLEAETRPISDPAPRTRSALAASRRSVPAHPTRAGTAGGRPGGHREARVYGAATPAASGGGADRLARRSARRGDPHERAAPPSPDRAHRAPRAPRDLARR